jgi:chromosomal replication initiator protein
LQTPRAPLIEDIQRVTCRFFKVSRNDMLSSRRDKRVAHPRHIAMFLAKTLTLKSLPELGRRFGGRDHTTILHGVRKIESLVRSDWEVAFDVAQVERTY